MRVPPLVCRAEALAAAAGLDETCPARDGMLLHVLAARRGLLRAGQIGVGCGTVAAWIVSALEPRVPFVGVERAPARAAVARSVFAEDENARVLCGDWRALLAGEAPFDLLVAVVPEAGDDPGEVVGLLAPGATAVLAGLPARSTEGRRCEAWLAHGAFAATVVGTDDDRRAVVATRVR